MTVNDLNSTLLEGTIEKAEFEGESARLLLNSQRVFKKDGGLQTENSGFVVRTDSKELVKAAKKQAVPGTKVRVVGRLYNDWDKEMRVVIIAEHIEYRTPSTTASHGESGI
jgi:single-stranded DNA-binding protein